MRYIIYIMSEYYEMIYISCEEVICMGKPITITKRSGLKGDDGHRVLSVRLKESTVEKLDRLAEETYRSRNQLINMLLDAALDDVTVVEEK